MKKILTTTIVTLMMGFASAQYLSLESDMVESKQQSTTFIENRGQVFDQYFKARPDVLFSGDYEDMVFHLKKSGVSYQLYQFKEDENPDDNIDESEVSIYRIDMNWINSNSDFRVKKGEVMAGYYNYYNTLSQEGISSVNAFENVTFSNLYQGIDLKYYQRNGQLEYDFIVHPHANHSKIRWKIEGADDLLINEKGQLVISTPFGLIHEDAPIAFQEGNEIKAEWILFGNTVGFDLADYDKSKELIIDPVIRVWGTYLGGSGIDQANSCEVDGNNNLYIAGSTHSSSSIATSGAFQTSIAGLSDGFVTKFDSSGTLLWSTYFGSTGSDFAEDCAVDAAGNVYLTGFTQSGLNLGTSGTYQPSYGGGFQDAFLVKFNSSGSRIWATYFGGKDQDRSYAVEVDYISNIYIGGHTLSDSGIATNGSHQSVYKGGDAFLAKFSSGGSRIWATYYGDSTGGDDIFSIKTDIFLNVYVSGVTSSLSDIASNGAHQTTLLGVTDAFVAKFSYSGARLWASYYGGTGDEVAYGCNVDDSMNVYITGYTTSTSNVATNNAHQSSYGGSYNDCFLAKFNTSGTRQWATYYGGNGMDIGYDIDFDSTNVYLTGVTFSNYGFASYKSHQTYMAGDRDAFLAKFNNDGLRIWGTYYGGTGWDYGSGLALDDSYNIYMAGRTKSSSGISTTGSHQTNISTGGQFDAYLAKFRECLVDSTTISASECDSYTSPSSKFTWTSSGTFFDTLMNAGGCDSIIKVELTILKTTSSISVNACHSYQTPSGKATYTESGKYRDTLINQAGCDSIITINLTINAANTNVSIYPPTLTAAEMNASYQWLDCDNGHAPISGATSRQFTASSNGYYAVVVSDSMCSDTSTCYEITGVGIVNNQNNIVLNVFPNPAKDKLNVSCNEKIEEYKIFNSQGSMVDQGRMMDQSIDVQNLTNGIYFLQIPLTGQVLQHRFIIRK